MRELLQNHVVRILLFFVVIAIGSLLFYDDSIRGVLTILMMKDILLTDYIEVAGLASTLLNVAIVGAISVWMMQAFDVEMTGFAYAGLFTTIGFSFFGKNYYNILPIYLGIYLYSRFMKQPFKQFVVMTFFASCLAPFTTIWMDAGWLGIIGGFCLSLFLGLIICAAASATIRFHSGYLLYNFGFAGGILAIIVTSILRTFDFEIVPVLYVNESMTIHWILVAIVLTVSLYLLIVGLQTGGYNPPKYKKLLKSTGRVVSDFHRNFGEPVTLVNMGLVGLIQLVVALLLKVPLNGPTVGGIFTCIGFAAFGKHPRNIYPIMLGSILMVFLTKTTITPVVVLTIIFASGLAPIAGEFGVFVGILTGMLHLSLAQYTAIWQGGINLYNNGFSAGFIAGTVSSIMEQIKRRNE